jgi:hypothetical protein
MPKTNPVWNVQPEDHMSKLTRIAYNGLITVLSSSRDSDYICNGKVLVSKRARQNEYLTVLGLTLWAKEIYVQSFLLGKRNDGLDVEEIYRVLQYSIANSQHLTEAIDLACIAGDYWLCLEKLGWSGALYSVFFSSEWKRGNALPDEVLCAFNGLENLDGQAKPWSNMSRVGRLISILDEDPTIYTDLRALREGSLIMRNHGLDWGSVCFDVGDKWVLDRWFQTVQQGREFLMDWDDRSQYLEPNLSLAENEG